MTTTPRPAIVSLIVPGEPLSKQRARVVAAKNGRGVVSYTPKVTRQAEERIAVAFMLHKGERLRGSLDVDLRFACKSKAKRDIDNMAKLVLDALNGLAWGDDSQIQILTIRRVFVDCDPFTQVSIRELSGRPLVGEQ